MDPFLSIVASAFPGRAGFIRKGRQSPKAAIPIGQRAEGGEGPTIIPGRSTCSLQIRRTVGHPRPSTFSMKKSLDLRKRFPSPAASLSLLLMVRGSIPLLVGILSSLSQIGGVSLNIGSKMI